MRLENILSLKNDEQLEDSEVPYLLFYDQNLQRQHHAPLSLIRAATTIIHE
uniref:AraC family transcriptional regulator n=1 Tax=Steinernema glaseri TaxID=37863 RepID=A0A1I8AEX7_9BILA